MKGQEHIFLGVWLCPQGWLADKNALVKLGAFQVKELQEGLHNFFSVDVFVLRILHLAPA